MGKLVKTVTVSFVPVKEPESSLISPQLTPATLESTKQIRTAEARDFSEIFLFFIPFTPFLCYNPSLMPIQEPVTVLTNLPILFISIFCFLALRNKSQSFLFAMSFLFLFLMSFCGMLYHTNSSTFLLSQKYGTMIFGGLFSVSLALAALFDNFRPKIAIIISGLPLAFLIFYLFTIGLDSFMSFIALQFSNIAIILVAYAKGLPGKKSVFIYLSCLTFILAGFVQTQDYRFLFFNHNDIFHVISLLSVFLLYFAVIADRSYAPH
jgi:hypothetical protein